MTVNTMFESLISTALINTASRTATNSTQNTQTSPTFAQTLKSAFTGKGGEDLDAYFEAAGRKYDISPDLLKAVAKVESNFRPDVVSRAGATGVMQLMPGTARGLGVEDSFNPEQNIMGGAKYLKQQLDNHNGDVRLALAAYNAGPGAVKKYGGIPPYKETQAYVPKVLGNLEESFVAAGDFSYKGVNKEFGLDTANGYSAEGYNADGTQQPTYAEQYAGQSSDNILNNINFTAALAQMLFIKMIEMQMSSSGDDKKNSIIF